MANFYARYPGSGGGGGSGVTSLNTLTGDVDITAGTGISVAVSGQDIIITATGAELTFGNLTDNGTDGIVITGGTDAVQGSGTSIAQHVSDTTHNGYLSSTDWNTFNGKQDAGSYITALTGDGTASGPGSAALTLATVNTNIGTFASSTVNGKGLVTAAGNLTGDITTSGAVSTLATVNTNVGSFTNANITVNAKGLVTAAANGTPSGVTSVAMTVPTGFSISGSPITSSGTLGLNYSGTIPNSSLYQAATAVTTTYTTLVSDTNIYCDMSGSTNASYAVTLLTAVGHSGLTQTIKNVKGSGVLSINTTSSQTVDGLASGVILLPTVGDTFTVFSDGSNWHISSWGINVSAYYNGIPTGTITNSNNKATYPTKIIDTYSAYSSGVYTVIIPGTYSISAAQDQAGTYTTGEVGQAIILYNSTQISTDTQRSFASGGSAVFPLVTSTYHLLAGDTITIQSFNNSVSPSFTGDTTTNWFSIARTGN